MSLRKALKGNKGQRKKRTAMLLLLALGIGCARPIAADVIGDAQKEKENAQANLNEINRQIQGIQAAQNSLQAEMAGYDEQLMVVLTDMELLQSDMELQAQEIAQANADLENATLEKEKQYEAMKVRIRYMYENGEASLLEALANADGMSDFLNRAEYVSDVYEYDRRLLTTYEDVVRRVEELTVQLADEMAEMEMMKVYYQEEQASLEQIIAQKRAQMENFDSQLSNAQVLAQQYAQTIKQQNQIIAKEKEKAAKQAAENANKKPNNGGQITPETREGRPRPRIRAGAPPPG